MQQPFSPCLTFDHERTRPSPIHSAMAGLKVYKHMDLPDSIQDIEEYDVRLLAVGGFIRFCNEEEKRPLQFFGPFGIATKVIYWEHPEHGVELDPVTGDILGMREGKCPEFSDRRGDWKARGEEERKAWRP